MINGDAGVDAKSINGLIAPLGTPRDYINRVHRTVVQALNRRELQDRLNRRGGHAARRNTSCGQVLT